MHLEVLVEEPSAEAALKLLLPEILGNQVTFRILAHQDKHDLLAKLPGRLAGYRPWLPADYRIVVLVDKDREDCHEIKCQLEETARNAGFWTKTNPDRSGSFSLVNRLAVEELEAWFFGDVPALRRTYPKLPKALGQRQSYRNPDAIRGGTWEALERVLQRAGYYKSGLAKIEAARTIARHMNPDRNRSKSFQVFRDALRTLQ